MKILLLNPPALDLSFYGKRLLLSPCPGTGLSYLNSYLQMNGYDSKLYDFFFESWDYVEDILIKENADIVGITCLTEGRNNSFKLLSLIRRIKKETIVVFGGHHSTYMYDQLIKSFDIDYIVLGEGEEKFLNLIQAIEGKMPLESVGGIVYKKGGLVFKNSMKDGDFIKELDKLPFPLLEENLHIFTKYPSLKELHPKQVKNIPPEVSENGRVISIITSRGCPYNCQFCSTTLFWGKRWRFRSPKNIVDEIEYYYTHFGFRYFNFADDAFTIVPKRAIEICKEITNRNLEIYFDCTTRADTITDELVKWLKRAGCLFVALGVESGSRKILETINKKISPSSVIKAFRILKKNDLSAYPLLMVGNPGDNDETIHKTILLMKIIRPYRVSISKTTIFPGTDLYDLAKKQNFINDSYWLTPKPPLLYTYENSFKTMERWAFEIENYDKKLYELRILRLKLRVLGFLSNINSLTFKKRILSKRFMEIMKKYIRFIF